MESAPRAMYRHSDRLYLRPFIEEDLPKLVLWLNDADITTFLNRWWPQSFEDEKKWLRRANLNLREQPVFAVVLKEGDELVGSMGLSNVNWRDRTALSGTLIAKDHWGNGYAPEAKMLLLDVAFRAMNLRKINSTIWAPNARSLKYNAKCGYKEEGRRIEQGFIGGEYLDEVMLGVFKEDWLPIWEEFVKNGRRFTRRE